MTRTRRTWFHEYVPGRKRTFALCSMGADGQPKLGAFWPMTVRQLIGGRTWSLAVVRLDKAGARRTTG